MYIRIVDLETVTGSNKVSNEYYINKFKNVLSRHNMSTTDIDYVCPSQFTQDIYKMVSEGLSIPIEKVSYIGDRFGYTGTSSPFFAPKDSIDKGKVSRGDTVLFTSIGLGGTVSSVIMKY